MNAFARFAAMLFACMIVQAGLTQETKKDDLPEAKPEAKKDAPAEGRTIYRNVTPEKLESLLKDMKITYQKVKGKEAGIAFYDFEKNDFKIRLHNYQGKDLWIDAHFNDKVPLEDVNKWNVLAKFSRAVQLKGEKDTVSLESQLDCLGGVSDVIIRQFIERFDGELAQFAKFLSK